MRIYREEIFGPVIAMIPFTDVTDAIRQANNTEFGLAAYLYTEDRQEMRSISDAIESGLVGVNNTLVSTAETPLVALSIRYWTRKRSLWVKGIPDHQIDHITTLTSSAGEPHPLFLICISFVRSIMCQTTD